MGQVSPKPRAKAAADKRLAQVGVAGQAHAVVRRESTTMMPSSRDILLLIVAGCSGDIGGSMSETTARLRLRVSGCISVVTADACKGDGDVGALLRQR